MKLLSIALSFGLAATASAASNGIGGDTCADPIAVSVGVAPFDTTGYIDSGFYDGTCEGRDGAEDIWFVYTAPASGVATIGTCGSTFDTVLRVLEGPDCASLTCLAGNDDFCALAPPATQNWASQVDVSVVGGQQYLIQVEGWGSGDVGPFDLSIDQALGDDCSDAIAVSAGITSFDTTGYTDSGFYDGTCEGRDGAEDIWFSFIAPADGVHTVGTCGAEFDTVLRVLEGPDCATLTCLAGNDDFCALAPPATQNWASQVDATLVAGQQYLIQVEGWGSGDVGAFDLSIEAPPSGDDCGTALTLPAFTGLNFDTSILTASGVGTCTSTPGVWYVYTQESPFGTVISTCGSSFDTKLSAYTGDCSSLVEVTCNDDACSLQSQITLDGEVGDVFYIQVGGFGTATGAGQILAEPVAPPDYCLGTPTLGGNGGSAGGAVYLDITATADIQVSGYYTNTSVTAGDSVGQTIYINTADVTHVGYEQDPTVWTPVAQSNGVSAGSNEATPMRLTAPLQLPAGTYGVCIVNSANMDHRYTNGNGTNELISSADGVVTFSLGAGQNIPFSSSVFSPRVWNGGFCYDQLDIGTNYCTANVNSTGSAASMSASGSTVIQLDQLVLETSNLPTNSVGYFIASLDQGFTANPGGSSGNLCLGGTIGRGMGDQVVSTGSGSVATPMGLALPFNLTGGIAPGDSWNFQLWFRDNDGMGGVTSNFSDGYTVTFQ